MHYKMLLDPSKFLSEADFSALGKEVTISRVSREKLPERKGEPETSAPLLYIVDKAGNEYPRPMRVPKLVLYGLSLLFGSEVDAWTGKKVTIFSAHCLAFGDKEPCLRIRFPAEVELGIRKHCKKRKINYSMYILEEKQ